MSYSCMDDPAPAPAPVLSSLLLARVREFNLDYLELLIADCSRTPCAGQALYLPKPLRSQLPELSVQARRLLAAIPLALYSLGFASQEFWRMVCEPPLHRELAPPVAQRYACAACSAGEVFCELALLHAWHVASANRLAARVVYAMPDSAALRLVAMPMWHVKRIAAEHADLLAPRWPTNPRFWPDLVRFATREDLPQLETAKLLGNQLIAAELAAANKRRQG